MYTTLLISFREYLEAFLIIGVFLGISKKLQLKKEKEILLASLTGMVLSLLLPFLMFLFGEKARIILNEKNADILESYLLIFSGIFIAYVVFSLHNFFHLQQSKYILKAHEKLKNNIFDLSLFLLIVFFVLREGFEVALFTATTSLFSKLSENLAGLFLGFAISSLMGAATFLTYIRFSLAKVFKLTQYLIIVLGASFFKNGVSKLLQIYLKIDLGKILPMNLNFLPAEKTFFGHFLTNIFGLEQDMSLAKVAIMVFYMICIYFIFLRKSWTITNKNK